MQSTALSFSPSISLPKLWNPSRASLQSRFSSHWQDSASSLNVDSTATSFPKLSWSSSSPSPQSRSKTGRFEVKATAVPEEADKTQTLELGVLFVFWFMFNIYFNIYNKQVLKGFHYPATVTLIQFAIGTVIVLCLWGVNLYRPRISRAQVER